MYYQLQSQSFKIVDCKLFFIFLQDLKRQRMMSKIKADDHVFVKLAFNPNTKAPKKAPRPADNSIELMKIGSNVTFGYDAEKNSLGVNYMYANSSEESR